MGVDPQVLHDRLRHLEQCLADLDDLGRRDAREIAGTRHLQRALERNVQLAVETCFDIASHILSRLGPGAPGTYAAYAEALFEAGLIDQSSVEKVRGFASLRNRLVHVYLRVTLRELHDFARNELGFFHNFARTTETLLRRQERPEPPQGAEREEP